MISTYKLSLQQENVLFGALLGNVGMEQHVYKVSNTFCRDAFIKAWDIVISVNEVLKSHIEWKNNYLARQCVDIDKIHEIEYIDLTKISIDKAEQQMLIKIMEQRDCILDLQKQLFKITVYIISDSIFYMEIINHHILFDGWSNSIILNEWLQNYYNISANKFIEKEQKTKYKSYVEYQQKYLENISNSQITYWKNYLDPCTDYCVNNKLGYLERYQKHNLALKKDKYAELEYKCDELQQLQMLGRKLQISYASIIYALWSVLLSSLSGNPNILFGFVRSGRTIPLQGIDKMVGLFIETLPFFTVINKSMKLIDYFKCAHKTLLEINGQVHVAFKQYEKYNLSKIGHVLYDNIVTIQNYPISQKLYGKGDFSLYKKYHTSNTKLSLSILMEPLYTITFTYNTLYYTEEFINRIVNLMQMSIIKIINENDAMVNVEDLVRFIQES